MKWLGTIILAALVSLVVALAVPRMAGQSMQAAAPASKESAMDRVLRTGVLRCGYVVYPTILERDPNTGAFSGLYYDFLEEIGRQANLKIEWTEEVGLATGLDGLKTGRYDVTCMPYAQTMPRARVTLFTDPALFAPFFIYARSDDPRFDNKYDAINDAGVRVAYLEGELAQTVKGALFSKAQSISLPNLTDPSQVYMQVVMNKADIVLAEPSSIEAFMKNNPGKIKQVPGPSVWMQPMGLSVAPGEFGLHAFLNAAIHSLIATGHMTSILDRHTTGPGQFYYAASGWGDSSKPRGSAR